MVVFFKDTFSDFAATLMLNSDVECSGRPARDVVLAKYVAYRILGEEDMRSAAASILARLSVGEWDEMRSLYDYFGVVAAHTIAHALFVEAAARSSRGAVEPVYGVIRHHGRRLYYAGIVDTSGVDVVGELWEGFKEGGRRCVEAGLAETLGSYVSEHSEGFEAGGSIARMFRDLGLAPDPHTVAVLAGAGLRGLRSCLDSCGDSILLADCREGRLQPLFVSSCVLKLFLIAAGVRRTGARLLATSYALRWLALSAAYRLDVTTAYTTPDALMEFDKLLRRGVEVRVTIDERSVLGRDGPMVRRVLHMLKTRYPRLFSYEYAVSSHAKVIRVDDLKIDTSWNYSKIPRTARRRYAERPVRQSVSLTYLPLAS